jgi:hypothetical protein
MLEVLAIAIIGVGILISVDRLRKRDLARQYATRVGEIQTHHGALVKAMTRLAVQEAITGILRVDEKLRLAGDIFLDDEMAILAKNPASSSTKNLLIFIDGKMRHRSPTKAGDRVFWLRWPFMGAEPEVIDTRVIEHQAKLLITTSKMYVPESIRVRCEAPLSEKGLAGLEDEIWRVQCGDRIVVVGPWLETDPELALSTPKIYEFRTAALVTVEPNGFSKTPILPPDTPENAAILAHAILFARRAGRPRMVADILEPWSLDV